MALCVAYRGIFARNASEIAQLLPLLATPWKCRIQALRLSLEGLGIRAIGRFLKVSHVTVLYWIRNFAKRLKCDGESVDQSRYEVHFCDSNG